MAREDLPGPGVGEPSPERAGPAHAPAGDDAQPARSVVVRAGQRVRATAARAARWIVLHSFVAALSVGAGLLVVALATEYGYHPVRNTETWASQPFGYAIGGACAACHEPQQRAAAQGAHDGVRCEACHGPQEAHVVAQQAAASAAGSPSAGGPVLAASSEAGSSTGSSAKCLACHEAVLGKPRAFPMISTVTHFGAATCALCHDPHATTPLEPPIVRHELAGLPDCLTCHGPGTIRAMSEAHPVVTGLDCLACHLRRTN